MKARLTARVVALSAVLAASSLSLPAPSASAEGTLAGTGAGFAIAQTIRVPRSVTAVITAHANIVLNTIVVEFRCEVTATGDAVSTGVDVCSAHGVSGIPVPNNLPGPYSTAVGEAIYAWDGAPPELCVAGHAAFLLGGTISTGNACDQMVIVTNNSVYQG